MSAATVYSHPDGHEIALHRGLLTACTSEGTAVSIPIGPDGLAALGASLIECANNAKHGKESERAGFLLGRELLRELHNFQGCLPEDSLHAFHDKLIALRELENFDYAAGGFTSAVIEVLELGIACQKVEGA